MTILRLVLSDNKYEPAVFRHVAVICGHGKLLGVCQVKPGGLPNEMTTLSSEARAEIGEAI